MCPQTSLTNWSHFHTPSQHYHIPFGLEEAVCAHFSNVQDQRHHNNTYFHLFISSISHALQLNVDLNMMFESVKKGTLICQVLFNLAGLANRQFLCICVSWMSNSYQTTSWWDYNSYPGNQPLGHLEVKHTEWTGHPHTQTHVKWKQLYSLSDIKLKVTCTVVSLFWKTYL